MLQSPQMALESERVQHAFAKATQQTTAAAYQIELHPTPKRHYGNKQLRRGPTSGKNWHPILRTVLQWTGSLQNSAASSWRGFVPKTLNQSGSYEDWYTAWDTGTSCTIADCRAGLTSYSPRDERSSSYMGASGTATIVAAAFCQRRTLISGQKKSLGTAQETALK